MKVSTKYRALQNVIKLGTGIWLWWTQNILSLFNLSEAVKENTNKHKYLYALCHYTNCSLVFLIEVVFHPLHQWMHTTLFIILFNKGLTKIIHQKPRSHHATSTHPVMSENHANRALCPKNMKIPHQLRTGNISYPRHPLTETIALIWSRRLLASTLCTWSHHLHQIAEQSSR
jgi:hypothetical protein